jgi:hypothetical protein
MSDHADAEKTFHENLERLRSTRGCGWSGVLSSRRTSRWNLNRKRPIFHENYECAHQCGHQNGW